MSRFYAGEDLYADQLALGERYMRTTGIGLVTVAASGDSTLTFDTKNAATDVGDITVSGTNNTTFTFNEDGQYDYGFGVRFAQAAVAVTGGDWYAYVWLNSQLEIGGQVIKPVLSNAAAIVYYATFTGCRNFVATDSIVCRLRNGTNVSVSETTAAEMTNFWAKRTIGGY